MKPEAPEFVPRHLRTDIEGPDQSTKADSKLDSKEKHRKEIEEMKREKEEWKKPLNLAKKAAKTTTEGAENQEGWCLAGRMGCELTEHLE